jgi:transcriptional regulator with XRE-family HTH domain
LPADEHPRFEIDYNSRRELALDAQWKADPPMEQHLVQIAERIRRWRDEAGFTLQQLADRSGVAASTVHKIEKNQTVPTISVLLKIAHALRRRPDELLKEESPEIAAAHRLKDDRLVLGNADRTQIEQLALGIARSTIDVWRLTHQPGQGSGLSGRRLEYDGEVIALVESGELTFQLGNATFVVHEGDSLHFKTSVAHSWENTGEGAARAIFFGTLPKGLQKGISERVETLLKANAIPAA